MIENLFEQSYAAFSENVLYRWLLFVFLAAFLTIVLKTALKFISRHLRKWAIHTNVRWDEIGADILDALRSLVLFVAIFFLLTRPLEQSESLRRFLMVLTVIAIVYQIMIWGLYLIKKWYDFFLEKKMRGNPSSGAALGLMYTGVQITFISLVVLIGLSNIGVDITALLAGLGVGGIAVALAAQNVLGDLLASLSIVLDKPFVIGDFIIAGDEMGTVEHIGIKTTRLRSLSGEQLVLSNKDLLESRIKNYKRMQVRRVVQKFGVVYSTSADTLALITTWVKEIVDRQDQLRFDRCHFFSYGQSSLDFELVFFVKSAEYNVFMDLQQIVLLDIYKKFAQEKVEFAFPTSSIYIEKLPEVIVSASTKSIP